MLRTILAHHDLTVVFKDLCFDFTRVLVHQRLERHLTGNHRVANFFYAGWTKTIGFAWETQWRSTAFVGFEQRAGRPARTYRFTFRKALVK